MKMTADELITRVHQQRADLAAVELAMDALMKALPPELQTAWLQSLQTLQAMQLQVLTASGRDPQTLQQTAAANSRRAARLQQSSQQPG